MRSRYFVKNKVAPAVALLLCLQAGCAAPVKRGELLAAPLPEGYRASVGAPTPVVIGAQPAIGRLWGSLGDPQLTALIARAMVDNLDVAAASARITAAREYLGVARARFAPSVYGVGGMSREKLSRNGLLGSSAAGASFPETYTQSDLRLDASWELDLFGVNRANKRDAIARHAAAVADLEAVRLSLSAEVARVFVEHVVLSQQLVSANREVALGEEGLSLISQQYSAGQEAESSVIHARLALEDARSDIARLESEMLARRHAMAVLLGTGEPIDLPASSPMLGETLVAVRLGDSLDTGLPSDLLRRRPDILRAEAELQSATALRDLAVADQYPRFTLTAGAGFESIKSGSLVEAASRVWHFAPQLALPMFDGGARRAVVRGREAELDAAIATYRKSVIGALSDVEQALIRYQGARRSMFAALERLAQAERLLHLAESQHAQGETAMTEVLEARRLREGYLAAALHAKQLVLLDFVVLHKALGGDPGSAPA
jgi:NodT family efflux transporter outer membrane factor (OMF) lipoprotein